MVLTVRNLVAGYGRSQILNEINLEVNDGELVCVLGRNGVGKSTLLKAIMKIIPPEAGDVIFKGESIVSLPKHEVCRRGLGYVPQERNIFPKLTVEENLQIPLIASNKPKELNHVYDLFPVLKEKKDQMGGTLSGGQQQMLAIGRGLSSKPDLLLMDEPSEGIQPSIVVDIKNLLLELKQETSILMVEQNVALTQSTADRCYGMDRGEIVIEGRPEELELEDLVTAPSAGAGD